MSDVASSLRGLGAAIDNAVNEGKPPTSRRRRKRRPQPPKAKVKVGQRFELNGVAMYVTRVQRRKFTCAEV